MIKDIQTVSASYNFNNDIIVYEKMSMFYFKVVINSHACTILSHNHKIITDADIIINSMWQDVKNFVNNNILSKQNIISKLYNHVIIGFFYCPNKKPLHITYDKFINTQIHNNKFIINNIKDINKNEINIEEFCKNINLLDVRGIGGGPIIITNTKLVENINKYAHNEITLDNFIDQCNINNKTYSGNDFSDIEGIIIKSNKNIYQIKIKSPEQSVIYNRNDFELLTKDFIDNYYNIDIINSNNYIDIICNIFIKYIEISDIHNIITNPNNLLPPGEYYIGDLCYDMINNENIKTICKLDNIYKNIFRILFKGLKHHKKYIKSDILLENDIIKWNNIVDDIMEKIRGN